MGVPSLGSCITPGSIHTGTCTGVKSAWRLLKVSEVCTLLRYLWQGGPYDLISSMYPDLLPGLMPSGVDGEPTSHTGV